jgi:hypothetical protein
VEGCRSSTAPGHGAASPAARMSEALSAAGPASCMCGLAKIARYCFAVGTMEGAGLDHCGMPLREKSIRIGGRTLAEFANRYIWSLRQNGESRLLSNYRSRFRGPGAGRHWFESRGSQDAHERHSGRVCVCSGGGDRGGAAPVQLRCELELFRMVSGAAAWARLNDLVKLPQRS